MRNLILLCILLLANILIGNCKTLLNQPKIDNKIVDSSFDLKVNNTYNPLYQTGWCSFSNYNNGEFTSTIRTDSVDKNYYECVTTTSNDNYNRTLAQYTSSTLAPGKYKLSLKSKTDGGSFYIKLSTKSAVSSFLGVNPSESSFGFTLSNNRFRITPTTNWQEYSGVFELNSPSADYIRFYITFDQKGTFDIDDIKLYKYPPDSINTDSLINASQTGSLPLTFLPFQYGLNPISVASFNEPNETTMRNGLPNFFKKIQDNTDTIKIGFIGGSITRANDMYRGQTLDYLQNTFKTAKFKGINAGVSGTGTDLGAFRIKEQLLDYNPDIVFIEFAVNGGSNEAMEGMVRQILNHNPKTDICFIYTIYTGQTSIYQSGNYPSRVTDFEKIATYYNLPSMHLGMYPSKLESEGLLVWMGPSGSTPIALTYDGTHPNREGGDLYAGAIARGITKMSSKAGEFSNNLPSKLYNYSDWDQATMYNPSTFTGSDISEIVCSQNTNFSQFKDWFDKVKVVSSGHSVGFELQGSGFGLFDVGGPEAGAFEFIIDGSQAKFNKVSEIQYQLSDNGAVMQINRFNQFCNNRYRGQFFWIDLPDGKHNIQLKSVISSVSKLSLLTSAGQSLIDIQSRPEVYVNNELMIGRILVKGSSLKVISSVSTLKYIQPLFCPNPAKMLIRVNNPEMKRIEIINILGRKLLETNHTFIDVSCLEAGNYFVVMHAQTDFIQPLIIN